MINLKVIRIILLSSAVIFLAAACSSNIGSNFNTQQNSTSTQSSVASTGPVSENQNENNSAQLNEPINNALSRVTKKPFGIKISPGHSPISPEKFSGYHTGTDFETTPAEQNIAVPISAVCTGPVKLAKWASGYGGVLVQQCKLDNQDVTIIYGHLNITSVTVKVAQTLQAGQQFAILGQGYTEQTDGERKHLHFGIHKGTSINILGYVQNQADLTGWLDPLKFMK